MWLNVLWYAGIAAQALILYRLWALGRPRSRYFFFAVWIAANAAMDIIRKCVYDSPWLYSEIWAITEFLVIVCTLLSVRETIVRIRRYYPLDPKLTCAVTNALLIGGAAVWWASGFLEFSHIHWNVSPMSLVVQFTMLFSPVIALTLATTQLALWALAQAFPCNWPRNLGWHVVLLSAALAVDAGATLAVGISEAHPLAYDIIANTEQALMLAIYLLWIWRLTQRFEHRLWDFTITLDMRKRARAETDAQKKVLTTELRESLQSARESLRRGYREGER